MGRAKKQAPGAAHSTKAANAQILWHIAAYIRLSREDDNENENDSVVNQKKILCEYIERFFEGEYVIADFYIEPRLLPWNEALNLTHQLVVDMQRLLSFSAVRTRWLLDADAVDQFEQGGPVEGAQAHVLFEQGDELRNIPRGGFQHAHAVLQGAHGVR